MKYKKTNNDEGLRGLYVEVKNGDFAKAYRKFKKKVTDDGILQDIRKKEYFEKPSIKRKRAKAAARSRWLKKLSQESRQN